MPYFMLRGILKISNPVAMIRSVLDLFLARPFGSTSLVQKMFSSGLNEEAKDLRDDAELVARKIGDDRLCEKVRQFVDAPRDDQDAMRLDAESEGIDLMTVILRQAGAPRLDPRTMQYLARCAVRYEEYKAVRDALHDPDDDEGPTNDEAWLYEDLHVYKRLVTAARDKEQLIELIFEVRLDDCAPCLSLALTWLGMRRGARPSCSRTLSRSFTSRSRASTRRPTLPTRSATCRPLSTTSSRRSNTPRMVSRVCSRASAEPGS